jgi:hypothetical protein
MLDRIGTGGLQLTAAGFLKPADVRDVAAELPTMADWIFRVTTEIHTQPVLFFRDRLASLGLVRTVKAKLVATRKGRAAAADPEYLWNHLASTLIPTRPPFVEVASVIVLVHMATTAGRIDVNAVARTMTALGWAISGGDVVTSRDIHPIWNDLWAALGNVGERVAPVDHSRDRRLSAASISLIRDVLFVDVRPMN